MSEMRTMLVSSMERLLATECAPEVVNAAEKGEWPAKLWQALVDAGMTRAWLPEAEGGSGVGLGDVLAVLRAAGRHAAPVPLAETLLAGWMLSSSGMEVPDGPLTVAPVRARERLSLKKSGKGWTLSGAAGGVPWGRQAAHRVAIAWAGRQEYVVRIDGAAGKVRSARNLAGEPRDELTFDGVALGADAVAKAPVGVTQSELFRRGALARAALMAGATEKAMAHSLRYANERVQFGKPIGKFQSVQQQLALMSGEVAAACIAVEAAGASGGSGLAEAACAKVRVGEAAGVAAALAHQIHAAIGVTFEHTLHHSTRRLWSWREEFGAETDWAGYLGHWLIDLGAEGLWPAMTNQTGIPVAA